MDILKIRPHPTQSDLFVIYGDNGEELAHAKLALGTTTVPKLGTYFPLGIEVIWSRDA